MEKQIYFIENDLKDIKVKLIEIDLNIIYLKEEIKKISKNTEKMISHIDFVENTYETLKYPLNFIKNKIDLISGNPKSESKDSKSLILDVD